MRARLFTAALIAAWTITVIAASATIIDQHL